MLSLHIWQQREGVRVPCVIPSADESHGCNQRKSGRLLDSLCHEPYGPNLRQRRRHRPIRMSPVCSPAFLALRFLNGARLHFASRPILSNHARSCNSVVVRYSILVNQADGSGVKERQVGTLGTFDRQYRNGATLAASPGEREFENGTDRPVASATGRA